METIIINKKPYFCVLCSDKINNIDNKIVYLKEGKNWSGKYFFLEKLNLLEDFLIKKHKMIKLDNYHNCQLCSNNNISKNYFKYKKNIWLDSLKHYVDKHNIKPPSKFIRFILNNDPTNINKCHNSFVKINGKIKKIDKFAYVKIRENQLLILDALMEHGGIKPKYKEKHEIGFRYSEHAGVLEFKNNVLNKIVISGTTQRSDSDDTEIFLPSIGDLAYEHEYIFHTHPATPKPGGRVKDNILYEFPSVNDIYHFIVHYNYGLVQGSLIITPEGLYNIRKYKFEKNKIKLDKNMEKELNKTIIKIQHNAIDKFGENFTSNFFYSVIAQDNTYIDEINKLLKKYDIFIDFFPRQKNKKGNWVIGTIYLPICLSS
jgi:hypothetical protein